MKIKISSDSTCDLPKDLIEKYGISITPLGVDLDGKLYKDGVDISVADIFEAVDKRGARCGTSAVNVAEYTERFGQYLKDYDAVIQFHISSEISACYQNANIAAEEFNSVYTVDSRSLSTGIGLLAISAAEMAEQGADAARIKSEMDRKRDLLDVSFVIDTVEYLRRGGRCSALAAMGANLLSLHPCIELRGGKLEVGKKYRGSIEKCVSRYVSDRLEGRDDLDLSRIFITSSKGFSREYIDLVREEILKFAPFKEILVSEAGATVSCHCGPKTLGLLFFKTH